VNQVLEEFLSNHPGRDFVFQSATESPFAERKATVGNGRFNRRGLRLHYIDEGEGEPVIMLHGNPSWSFLYRNLIDSLRGSHRVIVPDHMGCGLSDKPDDPRYAYTLKSRVDDLEALLDHLGLDRELTLVLHDWGGMIGMTYAARHPERMARLVVTNTAAFHLPSSKALPLALRICRSSILAAPLVRGANAFCHGTALIGCKHSRMSRDVWRAYVRPYDSWAHRIAILRFVQDIPLRPGDPSYDLVTWVQDRLHVLASVPMLILWGMKDFVFDHHFLAEWQRRFPRAMVHRFARAGHYLFEDEIESTRALLQQFLAAQPIIRETVG
jgi:haloalkane dehalogenase